MLCRSILTVDATDTDGDNSTADGQSAVRKGDLLLGASGAMYYVAVATDGDTYTLKDVADGTDRKSVV